MKRMSIIGLCLMTTVAATMTIVVSASAAQPEFKSKSGFPITFTGENLLPIKPLLRIRSGNILINYLCLKVHDSGRLSSETTATHILLKYLDCTLEPGVQTCTTTGLKAGEIVTKALSGTTGFVSGTEVAGLLLKPESGNVFAEATCGALIGKLVIENSVIGELLPFKLGSETTTGEWVFEPNATNTGQKWSNFVGGPICEFIVNSTGHGWYTDRDLITYSNPVELK